MVRENTEATTVHIVERFAPGGIETLVADLVTHARDPQHIVSLCGTHASLCTTWSRASALTSHLHALDKKPGLRPLLVARLTRLLMSLRPRTVVVHHIGPLLYGGLAARLSGVDHLVHVEHDAWHYAHNPSHQGILRACARFLDPTIAAVSPSVAEAVRDLLPGRPVAVVAPGVCTREFAPSSKRAARDKLGLDGTAIIAGTVGRLEPVKGHIHLVRALAHLPEKIQLVVVGEGPERNALVSEANALGVGERVHLLGHRDDLALVYPAFDVFCLPSLAEGLPRTILEAQACGIPVVASATGGVASALFKGEMLVAPGDSAGLASAVAQTLCRAPEAHRLRDFVEQRYSLTATVRDLGALSSGAGQ